MKTMNAQALLPLMILSAVTLAVGCDETEAADDPGEVSLRPGSGTYGGVWLNTSSIGATEFSELDLKGLVHDGVRFTGAKLLRPGNVWLKVTGGEVVDGNLRAKVGKAVYQGADLVGSRWQLNLVDNDGDGDALDDDGAEAPVELWITGYTQISAKESRYVFETHDALGNVAPLCEADSAGLRTVVPIKDITVDPMTGDITTRKDTIYLACTSGAVGKAITWGYRPWERTLAEFEVATRMVRADYCYDGMPWTENGTHLQVRDKWDINTFLRDADPTEVVWTGTGVGCVNQPRNPAYAAPQVTCDGAPLPACPTDISMASYADTMFWTKVDAPE
jgi:hypothetical protein